MMAARGGHFDCVELLLREGAHVRLRSAAGATALALAGEPAVAALLRSYGAV
jgi:ankyrin repeat protein